MIFNIMLLGLIYTMFSVLTMVGIVWLGWRIWLAYYLWKILTTSTIDEELVDASERMMASYPNLAFVLQSTGKLGRFNYGKGEI